MTRWGLGQYIGSEGFGGAAPPALARGVAGGGDSKGDEAPPSLGFMGGVIGWFGGTQRY